LWPRKAKRKSFFIYLRDQREPKGRDKLYINFLPYQVQLMVQKKRAESFGGGKGGDGID